MKKPTLQLLSLLLLTTVPGLAPAQDSSSFWNTLGGKLEQLTPQKKAAVTSAVGGIRGAKDLPADTLYWKGETQQQTVDAEEYARFKEALTAGSTGQPQAIELFESFLRDFPQSSLRPEADSALQQLKLVANGGASAQSGNPPAPAKH